MANATVTYMKRKGVPLTEDNYRFFNWLGAPPEEMSAEEAAELPDLVQTVSDFDPDQPRDPQGRWTETGGSSGGGGYQGTGAPGGGAPQERTAEPGGAGRDPRLAEAQRDAETAAGGHPKLEGLPDKPIPVGDKLYIPGPLGKAKEAAANYMRAAALPYDPPKQYAKLDKERAARVANEFETMKHDPDNPAVKASYDALAKETLAQWQEIKKTGLKVEWIKEGQPDPYALTPRLAQIDVNQNNHWWGFPTDQGFGTGIEAAHARHNNPMLEPTNEVVDGRKLVVNDVFRIVHDYFGHFKEGNGFRAEGEENAWRSHAAMYSDVARPAMTSETRGQNSWVNYGPHGDFNRTASAGSTIYAPQKVGLMHPWTMHEGRRDVRDYDPDQPREPAGSPEGGQFASSGGGQAGGSSAASTEPALNLDPVAIDVSGDEWNKKTAVRLESDYQRAKPALESIASKAVGATLTTAPKDITEFDPDDDVETEPTYPPETWDEIDGSKQEEIKNDWMEKTANDFLKQEIDNWQDSGNALDDAKDRLAYQGTHESYVDDALDALREDRRANREPEIPFSNYQLSEGMKFEYETGYEGAKDVEITWNDEKLGTPTGWFEHPTLPGIEPLSPSSKLTEEMRTAIEAVIVKEFNTAAEKLDIEPPEYLKESIGDSQDLYWEEGMSGTEKFNWASDNGHVEEPESSKPTKEPETLSKLPDQMDPLGERDASRDYQITKLLAAYMSNERGVEMMQKRGLFENRGDAMAAVRTFDSRLWTAWKGDSASHDGLILQAATAAELGGRFRSPVEKEFKPTVFINASGKYAVSGKTAEMTNKFFETEKEAQSYIDKWWETAPKSKPGPSVDALSKEADKRFGSAGGWEGVKAYVRAKWEVSQYLLDKAGKSEVDLYRGIMLHDKGKEEEVPFKVSEDSSYPTTRTKLPEIKLDRNGAQSTTTDVSIANGWSGVGAQTVGFDAAQDRVVLRLKAPRTAVVGLPVYGKNVYNEHEVVVAGTAWKKWDAWLGNAPTFKQVPL